MRIVDSFLPQDFFDDMVNRVSSESFPWFYMNYVADKSDSSDSYLIHTLYSSFKPNSEMFNAIGPILDLIKPKALLRCRVISYIRRDVLIEHARHVDFDFPHNTCILYLNTNNGFTRLEDGEQVMSVANRALFSDGGAMHNSSNCTDAKRRLVLTFNYF